MALRESRRTMLEEGEGRMGATSSSSNDPLPGAVPKSQPKGKAPPKGFGWTPKEDSEEVKAMFSESRRSVPAPREKAAPKELGPAVEETLC